MAKKDLIKAEELILKYKNNLEIIIDDNDYNE